MGEDMTKQLKVGVNLISEMKKCLLSKARLENFLMKIVKSDENICQAKQGQKNGENI